MLGCVGGLRGDGGPIVACRPCEVLTRGVAAGSERRADEGCDGLGVVDARPAVKPAVKPGWTTTGGGTW